MLSILLYGEESIAKYRSKIFTIYFYLFILLDCYILRNDIIRTISLIFLWRKVFFIFIFLLFLIFILIYFVFFFPSCARRASYFECITKLDRNSGKD